jgi:uncharacterized membrane-anchored protein YitT (DUF2179 family)/predicted metal-dependent HD superfamily phosphohydrolase
MNYQVCYEIMMQKLTNELPKYLTYHNASHTQFVIETSLHLADCEGITNSDEVTILKTAALFHDSGFLISSQDHETHSCALANQYLADSGYTKNQIQRICQMIMATKLPQSPFDPLSNILCDADLNYLGTKDYHRIARNLEAEYRHDKKIGETDNWVKMQIQFLETHQYHTTSARRLYQDQKQSSLNELYDMNQSNQEPTQKWTSIIIDGLVILVGVFMAALALKGFLVPNHFFDGGITGISLLIHELTHANLAIIMFLFNLPFIIISYFSVSKSFAYKTLYAAVLLGLFLTFGPTVNFTTDKLLISIFGGAFLGLGVGIVMRAGGALDGIEVLALYTLKKTSFTITEIILGINMLIFGVAAFSFGIETALYSVLTYFCATQTIDYVIEGIQAYLGVTIVSGNSEGVKHVLVENLGRGITVYKGERGYLPGKFDQHSDCDIIFTVITRLELRKLRNVVHSLDKNAFIFVSSIKEADGGILKRINKH